MSAGEFVIRLTHDEFEAHHDAALARYHEAGEVLARAAAALPPLPLDRDLGYEDGVQFREEGYSRWEGSTVEDESLHIFSQGWDAMSEGGVAEWIEWDGRDWSRPDHTEWD